jgi:hypothetical protein
VWTGRGGRAALWRGSAASFVDLSPADQEGARAGDCAGGYQVGHCQAALATRGEVASLALRAALWAGTADSHVDLQAFVPPPWNASSASAVEVRGDRLRIVGEVTQFVVEGELTPSEQHLMVAEAPGVWEAILG